MTWSPIARWPSAPSVYSVKPLYDPAFEVPLHDSTASFSLPSSLDATYTTQLGEPPPDASTEVMAAPASPPIAPSTSLRLVPHLPELALSSFCRLADASAYAGNFSPSDVSVFQASEFRSVFTSMYASAPAGTASAESPIVPLVPVCPPQPAAAARAATARSAIRKRRVPIALRVYRRVGRV